jgi:adenine-specific DNA-methyltransferase
MKYMGSKRAMLAGGLGDILERNVHSAGRFVDMFTGSGSVAYYVAENFGVPVVATDLQDYAAALARSIVGRSFPLDFNAWGPTWIANAVFLAEKTADAGAAAGLQNKLKLDRLHSQATRARKLCADSRSNFVRAYGGWYFSPWQSLLLDCLRKAIEPGAPWEHVAIASVIQAASRCAAAPGHTAQPFKSDTGAAPFLLESWMKDVIAHVTVSANELSSRFAQVQGWAYTADANDVASTLNAGDLAFVDPPYSSVHYSRFYHVLESLARGHVGEVSGSGRYPAVEDRPSSDYSIPTKAESALKTLLSRIADAGANAIVTFPASKSSNRLSGERIKEIADDRFEVVEDKFLSKFSTLGGDRKHRNARQDTEELILTLRAR